MYVRVVGAVRSRVGGVSVLLSSLRFCPALVPPLSLSHDSSILSALSLVLTIFGPLCLCFPLSPFEGALCYGVLTAIGLLV